MEGYTQTPNCILDAMGSMSKVELKLTILLVRRTYGWHQSEAKLKYEDIQEYTGLVSRTSVRNAIKQVEKRGFFKRTGQSNWIANSTESVLFKQPNSTESVPKIVQKVYSNSTESVPYTYYINKNKENIKENERVFKKPTIRKQTTEADKRLKVILDVCQLNGNIPKIRNSAENIAAQLEDYSCDYLKHRYASGENPNGSWYWYRDDWRGQKGQPPTPDAILKTIDLKLTKPHKTQVQDISWQGVD